MWVLERSYDSAMTRLRRLIERILQVDELVVEHEAEVVTALTALWEGHGSFGDALIGASTRKPAVRAP